MIQQLSGQVAISVLHLVCCDGQQKLPEHDGVGLAGPPTRAALQTQALAPQMSPSAEQFTPRREHLLTHCRGPL